jgi:putative hemolysin
MTEHDDGGTSMCGEDGRGGNPAISLRRLAEPGSPAGRALAVVAPALDRMLGIHSIDRLYRTGRVRGLPPFAFAERALEVLGVSIASTGGSLVQRLPASGPVLVVCNHPFGAAEALILATAIAPIRQDVRFLANDALEVFPELAPLLIGTNPLRVSQGNLRSIRRCESHLEQGGVLVVFPAGRVSFRQRGEPRIADGEWNRIVGHLALRTEAGLLPVFFHGANGPLFHALGSVWDRAKLLMLPREMLRLKGRRIVFSAGRLLPAGYWRHMDAEQLTAYARVMTYLHETPESALDAASDGSVTPLAPPGDRATLAAEVDALPERQRLLEFRHFSVHYAMARQVPALMLEIARERERVFRGLAEGSGAARDSDAYDETYVQLFVWDRRHHSLVGAYRMGRTDLLREAHGAAGAYLSQMFEFDEAFYSSAPGSLELGRSFLVPEHQKSFHGLYLLWQGIGRFLTIHPQYRRLYGTVSLSRQYDDRAMAVLCDALIETGAQVHPRRSFTHRPHPEWQRFLRSRGRPDLRFLSALVRGLDAEGKDIPVLLKHYHKLGACFHGVAIDPNFRDTPGLLLSIDVPALGLATLATFLGDRAQEYLDWTPPGARS